MDFHHNVTNKHRLKTHLDRRHLASEKQPSFSYFKNVLQDALGALLAGLTQWRQGSERGRGQRDFGCCSILNIALSLSVWEIQCVAGVQHDSVKSLKWVTVAQCGTLESPAIATVTLTPPVDHTSCAEENDGSFPRPTCNLWLAWSGNSQAMNAGLIVGNLIKA